MLFTHTLINEANNNSGKYLQYTFVLGGEEG